LITIVKADSFPTRYLLVKEPQSCDRRPDQCPNHLAVHAVRASGLSAMLLSETSVNTLSRFFRGDRVDLLPVQSCAAPLQKALPVPFGAEVVSTRNPDEVNTVFSFSLNYHPTLRYLIHKIRHASHQNAPFPGHSCPHGVRGRLRDHLQGMLLPFAPTHSNGLCRATFLPDH
jgi:hypothetical protein